MPIGFDQPHVFDITTNFTNNFNGKWRIQKGNILKEYQRIQWPKRLWLERFPIGSNEKLPRGVERAYPQHVQEKLKLQK